MAELMHQKLPWPTTTKLMSWLLWLQPMPSCQCRGSGLWSVAPRVTSMLLDPLHRRTIHMAGGVLSLLKIISTDRWAAEAGR